MYMGWKFQIMLICFYSMQQGMMFFFIGITMALVQGMQNRTHKILYVTVILNGY